ncbi:hypothetical protein [Eubacterium callanderi]|uniref:hypothetical protein n=1 Tax=Eubacterium callanderi TaxID=53442 RepID=UPI001C10732E|nr:hypothetical protein [Eubacterium callanderi]MBU5303173.1 hypothetical protein [Eubacterium callanderi]
MYQLIGFRDVEFDTKEGKHMSGYSLFLLSKDENVIGMKADKQWFYKEDIERMGVNLRDFVGKQIDLYCDINKRPIFMQLTKQ